MYNGNEKLINNGSYLDFTMLDFWRWAYSNLLQNMQRGTLAEFIVKSSLEQNQIYNNMKRGLEPYDLDGPFIPEYNRTSRIEVKCSALVQLWDIKHPDRANFSISPAKLPDKTGDFNRNAPKQRNSDIYVFCVYTATDRTRNILDLSWWEFYVCTTNYLDEKFPKQKTITLKVLREFCNSCTFDNLFSQIADKCKEVSKYPDTRKLIYEPSNN